MSNLDQAKQIFDKDLDKSTAEILKRWTKLHNKNLKHKSLQLLFSILKGGAGSGNYGHAGRPGRRGGSAPKSGLGAAMSLLTGPTAKARQEEAAGKVKKPTEVTPAILTSNDMALDKVSQNASLGGISESYLVHVKGDGDAIVKPDGTSWAANSNAEAGAYEVSKALGFDVVPITVIRQPNTYQRGDGTTADVKGSTQQWIGDSTVGSKMTKAQESQANRNDLKNMAILDKLVSNTDRHSGNYIIENNTSRIRAIDHGLARFDKVSTINPLLYRDALGNKIKYTKADMDNLRSLENNTRAKIDFNKVYPGKWGIVVKNAKAMADEYDRDTTYYN